MNKKEEKKLLESVESGEWKSVKNLKKEIEKLREAARKNMKKDKRINLRISNKDLEDIQRIAIQNGMPYQTFIGSLIHKYNIGKLVEK